MPPPNHGRGNPLPWFFSTVVFVDFCKIFYKNLFSFRLKYGIIEKNNCEVKAIMAKLYFKYGAMGSSKTAQALITKFNYEERGMKVWLIKPALDDRDGVGIYHSRIGLTAACTPIGRDDDLYTRFLDARHDMDVIIADECQFFSEAQIDALRRVVNEWDIPVLCFGLRTDFLCHLFPGSRRLFEVADSISEIKTICSCGSKATVNARLDAEGHVVTEGDQVLLGGNDRYIAMCHRCWQEAIRRQTPEG